MESGKEFHMYHEIIFFLDGEAELITEDLHMELKPDSLIIIPKEKYHQVIIHGDQENYYRCVINFYDVPELASLIQDSMIRSMVLNPENQIRYLFHKLIENITHSNAQQILKAVLVLLLGDIQKEINTNVMESTQNGLVRSAIYYINNNINKKITINDIAKNCNMSPSSLSHVFKKEMKISLYKFILKKRLINAHHKIMSGEPPTAAAMECGFYDYSGFYKQYKKVFGYAPSQKKSVD